MSPQPLTVALLGCGGIASSHARAFQVAGSRQVRILAVSRDENRARETASRLKLDGALSPYQAALDNSDVNAVCILTPHDQHTDLASRALRAGKHVLLEKPVARTVDEAEPLARALAESPDQLLMVGENFHYARPIVQAAELVASGRIGRLHSVIANNFYCVRVENWRQNREITGGGCLIDGGIHFIHTLRQLGGEIASVYALQSPEKWNQMEGEAALQMLMQFESGATCCLNYSWDYHGDPFVPDLLVLGTEGSVAIHLRQRENLVYLSGAAPPERQRHFRRFGKIDLLETMGHVATAGAFLKALGKRASPEPDLQSGLRDVRVVEAAYRSLQTSQPEEVQPLPEWAAREHPHT